MKNAILCLLVLSFAAPSFAWFWSKEEWTGIVYPNRDNLFRHKIIGVYKDVNVK
jgi:hypothetical protein